MKSQIVKVLLAVVVVVGLMGCEKAKDIVGNNIGQGGVEIYTYDHEQNLVLIEATKEFPLEDGMPLAAVSMDYNRHGIFDNNVNRIEWTSDNSNLTFSDPSIIYYQTTGKSESSTLMSKAMRINTLALSVGDKVKVTARDTILGKTKTIEITIQSY